MNKKKILWIIAATLIILGVFHAGTVVGAGTSVPGSSGDPLVTLSYLEARLSKAGAGGQAAYQKITLTKNQVLLLENGSEVILYSGSAATTGAKGMVNLSSGELFQSGNSAVKYQIYLSPSDTSGLKANSDITTYIKGSYTID